MALPPVFRGDSSNLSEPWLPFCRRVVERETVVSLDVDRKKARFLPVAALESLEAIVGEP